MGSHNLHDCSNGSPKEESISGPFYRSSLDAWAGDEVVQIGLRHADTLVGCT